MSPPRTPEQIQIGQFIVNSEARRDAKSRMQIYKLPAADGGGEYEVAGINDRYHPAMAKRLAALIREGNQAQAEQEAVQFILGYTDAVLGWHPSVAVEAFLRDSSFNRGPSGAAKIYQRAVGARIDGKVGPVTKATGAVIPPAELLLSLRKAREVYERQIAPPTGKRAKFWRGLVNRWEAMLKFSQGLL